MWLTDLHWGLRSPIHEVGKACIYLSPVLSHDEATALQARVAELERLGKAIATERNQLIGVLQLAVEQSAETKGNEPAWIDPACRILNAGFTKIAALEGKKE